MNFFERASIFSCIKKDKHYTYFCFLYFSRRSSSENHRYKPKNHVKTHHSSRSLDRLQHNLESDQYDSEANKENAFKTRIQVISPERQHMIQNNLFGDGNLLPLPPP